MATIPPHVLRELKLDAGSAVKVTASSGEVIFTPVGKSSGRIKRLERAPDHIITQVPDLLVDLFEMHKALSAITHAPDPAAVRA